MKILVTGGTGAIGRQVISDLRQRHPESEITVLSRKRQTLEGVNLLPGDLTDPDFIDGAEMREAMSRADYVLHCAADVRWSQSLNEAIVNNAETTRRLLSAAERHGRSLRRFVALSTAFVACPDTGLRTANTVELEGRVFNNSYEASKWLAERWVRESALPWMIVRPSLVVGHSETGALGKFNGLYRIMRLFSQGLVPIMVGNPKGLIDIVPVDVVSDAVFEAMFSRGDRQVLWAGSGSRAPTFEQVLQVLVETINAARSALGFQDIEKSPIIPYTTYEAALRPRLENGLRAHEFGVLASVEHFIPYLSVPQPISGGLHESWHSAPPHESYLADSMKYWCKVNRAVIARNGQPYDWSKLGPLLATA